MQYFAKKVTYAASGAYSFVALIELCEENATEPFCFVLYRYRDTSVTSAVLPFDMQVFVSLEEGEAAFPYGRGGYRSSDVLWSRTTDWLNSVAIGGGFQVHEEGTIVSVELPEDFPAEFLQVELAG